MKHVDAFSRVQHLLVIETNSMVRNMLIAQTQDPIIKRISCRLLEGEDKLFELRDGVVYGKAGKRILFYVPEAMICHILNTYHDKVGHCGIEKTVDLILNLYWFPNLKNIVKGYVLNCLKCISYSPVSGKKKGYLHVIPKGNLPLEATRYKKIYIFEAVDTFTKFVRFYHKT